MIGDVDMEVIHYSHFGGGSDVKSGGDPVAFHGFHGTRACTQTAQPMLLTR